MRESAVRDNQGDLAVGACVGSLLVSEDSDWNEGDVTPDIRIGYSRFGDDWWYGDHASFVCGGSGCQ